MRPKITHQKGAKMVKYCSTLKVHVALAK